jgi:signal transduction histidine kinase
LQFISPEGEVLNRSENLEEVTLPLSDAGWEAVKEGETWVETASVEGERLMIHSAPIMEEGQPTEIVQIASALAEEDQYLTALRTNLFIGSGLATLIAFGAGWILSGAVLHPVNRITQTARTIGAERDFGRRVDYDGPNDEVGQLATTFNAMLTELQAAYEQVAQSLHQQRQFVADVSHELRTPLTTIRGNLALLRREPPIGTEEATDILGDMAEESDRLIRLVNDLLMLAHAESGRLLRSETVRISPLLDEVRRQARLLDPERKITCTSSPDAAAIGDPDALKQVLLSLVDNALKHTTGPITVTVTDDDQTASEEIKGPSVSIAVRDSGPGIDPAVLPHVFERFYRGDGAHAPPGLGLGLPIAKALVEAQGGAIAVESEAGQGSVFTVTMPRREG